MPSNTPDYNVSSDSATVVRQAISYTPRKQFVATKHQSIVVGHSIPSEAIAQKILESLQFYPNSSVLQIGTGSGYLAAIISLIAAKVLTIEKLPALAKVAADNFQKLRLKNIKIKVGDGSKGAGSKAPFDIIIVATAKVQVQQCLLEQLTKGGQLIALEGDFRNSRSLVKYTRDKNNVISRDELGKLNFSSHTDKNLLELGVVDTRTLEKAKKLATRNKTPIVEEIRHLVQLEDIQLYRSLAKQHDLTLGKTEELLQEIQPRIFSLFSRAFLDHHRLIPISDKEHCLRVATTDPDAITSDFKAIYPNHVVEKILVTPTTFHRLWSSLELNLNGHLFEMLKPAKQEKEVNLLEREQTKLHAHLILVFEALLLDAIGENASDLHLEVYADKVRIRIRVDGELHDLSHYQLTPAEMVGLINVIKTRCELDISEHRLPQGGRTQLRAGSVVYDLRVQTQPSLHGEHVVIRLLRQDSQLIKIDSLGFPPVIAQKYERLLHEPAGLILVVGPTGTGKSTTLCAGLQLLAADGRRKVITVEDPIEYSIKNIQQTRVRSEIGFNFADAMRSFVRQDPDVILVGEIRDKETALEAIRASQTGHLVLSTLHSNDAVDALQRLFDLGVDPNSIAGELNAVIAQRLAKRICSKCKMESDPDKQLLAELFPSGAPKNFKTYEGAGCKNCGGRGTKGRIAVIEYLRINDTIRNAISVQPPISELRCLALDVGLVTMRDSALEHIVQGDIPLSELPRLLPSDRMAAETRGEVGI